MKPLKTDQVLKVLPILHKYFKTQDDLAFHLAALLLVSCDFISTDARNLLELVITNWEDKSNMH